MFEKCPQVPVNHDSQLQDTLKHLASVYQTYSLASNTHCDIFQSIGHIEQHFNESAESSNVKTELVTAVELLRKVCRSIGLLCFPTVLNPC